MEIRKAKDLKQFFKIFGTRILGIFIPVILYCIYLSANNIWADFLDYAIFGISTFSNTVPYDKLMSYGKLYKVLAYLIPTALIIMTFVYILTLWDKTIREKEWARRLRILFIYDLASIVVIYPIADRNHFGVGTICTILTVIYLVYEIGKYYIRNKEKTKFALKTFFRATAILFLIAYSIKGTFNIAEYIKIINNQNSLSHFNMIPTDEVLYKRIEGIDQFILNQREEGKKVYILDTMAAAFVIPTGEYHKNYDMFNIGNFGTRGEKRNNRRFRK